MVSHVWPFATPWTIARILCPWDFPGKNTAVGCHTFLQRIFLTQGWNPSSPVSPALAAGFFTLAPWEAHFRVLREAFFTFRPKGLTRLIISFSYGWIHLLGGWFFLRMHMYYFLPLLLFWSIIALQYCVSFCLTRKWISYIHTYIPSSLILPLTPIALPSHPLAHPEHRAELPVLYSSSN